MNKKAETKQQLLLEMEELQTKLSAAEQYVEEANKLEEERRKLIYDLQDALTKIKRLRGLLPICASCKKIRDDKGYWNELEAYISEHSEVEITHGFCPDCLKELYGVVLDEDTNSKRQ